MIRYGKDVMAAATIEAGWLSRDPITTAALYYGVVVPRRSAGTRHDPPGAIFPTRIEEYGWVVRQLEDWPRGPVLSAGSGFNAEVHVLEFVLANMGFTVTAIDANAEALQMPVHPNITRVLGDITRLDAPNEFFSAWISVSVAEHMTDQDRMAMLTEAYRVLQPNGLALLTTDHTPPEVVTTWFRDAGFIVGPVMPNAGPMLEPPVSYIAAQKPT